MKTTITKQDFIAAFEGTQYENNFTADALAEIFEYELRLEKDTGNETELDVCAIACAWSEYSSIVEYIEDNSLSFEDANLDKEETEAQLAKYGELTQEQEELFMGWLQGETSVIELDNGGLVVADY